MFHLQAITVLVVISGEILRCTRISSRQYFAAPSMDTGYPNPFAAITPAFVPRLLVKAICSFEKSFPRLRTVAITNDTALLIFNFAIRFSSLNETNAPVIHSASNFYCIFIPVVLPIPAEEES